MNDQNHFPLKNKYIIRCISFLRVVPWSAVTGPPGSPEVLPLVVLFNPPIRVDGEADVRPSLVLRIQAVQQVDTVEIVDCFDLIVHNQSF